MSPAPRRPPATPLQVRLCCLALGLVATFTVLHNQRQVGIARDETVYFTHGSQYAAWWRGVMSGQRELGEASITATFGGPGATDNNREHPPLIKTASGMSEHWLHDRLGLLDELTAYRLPSAVLHGLLVALVAAFASGAWGLLAGVVSALAMLLMPRALFHAGLACFDGPITALWFATLWAYHRALTSPRVAWLAGALFGLALATKHNALLLPLALAPHYLAVSWRAGLRRRLYLPLSFAVLGPLVLVALWPWLWFEPLPHLWQWISFHAHHVHYNFEYLGQNFNAPPFPWHVALVTTALTVPVATLGAATAGVLVLASRTLSARAARSAEAVAERPALLLLLSATAAMGPFFLRTTPIFGAEKHWEPAMPSLCIAAGVGLVALARGAARALVAWWPARWPALPRSRTETVLCAALAAAVLGSAAVETFHPQPYGLTAYNALAGGAPGAADLGMNRQFWGVAARGALPELARLAAAPDRTIAVYSHDASPAWRRYQALGLVPANLPDAGPELSGIERSELALVVHERHFARHDFMIWQAYGTVAPVFVLRLDGVPLVSVYRRPRPAQAPQPPASPPPPQQQQPASPQQQQPASPPP